MHKVGLINPIDVRAVGDGFEVVWGPPAVGCPATWVDDDLRPGRRLVGWRDPVHRLHRRRRPPVATGNDGRGEDPDGRPSAQYEAIVGSTPCPRGFTELARAANHLDHPVDLDRYIKLGKTFSGKELDALGKCGITMRGLSVTKAIVEWRCSSM